VCERCEVESSYACFKLKRGFSDLAGSEWLSYLLLIEVDILKNI
jgi:hypothetical protein